MTDRELQEQWLKNNKPKVVEAVDYSIGRDSLPKYKKSFLENNENRIIKSIIMDKRMKEKLDDGALSTLSNYSLVEKDELIGKRISCKNGYAIVMRNKGARYYCSDGKIRTKSVILKQLY